MTTKGASQTRKSAMDWMIAVINLTSKTVEPAAARRSLATVDSVFTTSSDVTAQMTAQMEATRKVVRRHRK